MSITAPETMAKLSITAWHGSPHKFDSFSLQSIGKFSANDEIRKILDGIKIVDNEELNSQQEKFSALGSELGCQIVWIDADPRLNGMHIPGTNVTLLNRKAEMSLQKTFWHETFHWIKANNEPLWEELLTYFKGKTAFTKEQIDSYREKYGRYDLQRDEDVIEELLADAFVDVKQRVPLMQEMAKENPSLAKKFVAWLKRIMDRFVEVFHNPEGKLTTAQRDQFVEAFGRLAASMVDGNKKKLFKTYNNGKRITFLDGEPLPEFQFSKRNKYSFAGENAENAPLDRLERAKEMGGKSVPDKIYEETGWFKGKDGKWRFEIPDNLDQIDFSDFRDGATVTTLGKIYDNQALYDAYPRLKDIRVGIDSLSENQFGAYNPSSKMIVLNGNKIDAAQSDDDMKKTLVHEIQHAIQGIEGFAVGGSMRTARDQILGEIRRIVRDQDFGSSEGIEFASLNDAAARLANKDDSFDAWWQAMQDIHEFEKSVPKEKMDKIRRLVSMRKKLSQALDSRSDRYLYENLGGEQEAREVERRSEGATRLSKQNSDTQEAEKALNDALENATENQMKAYRNREKLDKEIRKQGGRPSEEQLEKMESYDKAMGEALSEAYDNYLWERDTADEMKEEMGTPTPHDVNALIVFGGKEFAMASENDVDNSENIGDNESRETDPEIAKATERALFARYISANKRRELENGIKVDVARAKRSGTPIVRDSLRTINKMVDLFNAIPKKDSQRTNREMLATQIEYARRCFENEYSSDGRSEREDNGGYSSLGRGKASPYAGNLRDTSGQSAEASGKVQGEKAVIVDGERDDAKNFWRETFDREYKHQQDIRKGASTRTNASASSMPKNQDSTAGTKFSINASDNSTPSLAHRIKNILAGTPATAQAKEQYRRRMARMIEDALGIKIRTGKMDVGRPANGTVIYKPNDKVIRSLHAYDWENILPVASGLMAERLGIISRVIKPFTNRQHGISRKASMKNPKG